MCNTVNELVRITKNTKINKIDLFIVILHIL